MITMKTISELEAHLAERDIDLTTISSLKIAAQLLLNHDYFISANSLTRGSTGCVFRKDIKVGTRFGLLTVLEFDGTHPQTRAAMWLCRCDCGKEVSRPGKRLRGGHVLSCGHIRGNRTKKRKKSLRKFFQTPPGVI